VILVEMVRYGRILPHRFYKGEHEIAAPIKSPRLVRATALPIVFSQ
jgi:hypothetical protein